MTETRALIEDVRARLAAEADPDRAAGQQRYMKSEVPYYGVTMPRIVAIAKELFRAHPIEGYEDWRDTVLALFREAERRELWYVAEQLAEWPAYRAYARRLESLDLYEVLITEGAWWDIVDGVSAHLVGGLFATDAAWTAARMREWSTDEHLWKRRASIICQLRRREDVDVELLYDCIEPNLSDRDFFIRKAIGWALREVAKTQPHEVIRYVQEHRDALSGLSKREALKNVRKDGLVAEIPDRLLPRATFERSSTMTNLGTFSLSLAVSDISASRRFYEALGFERLDGDAEQGWLIMHAGEAKIGLFQGMFDSNIITFNPTDVRAIQRDLEAQGITVELKHEMGEDTDPSQGAPAEDSGPAHFTLSDPDGNVLLFDQF